MTTVILDGMEAFDFIMTVRENQQPSIRLYMVAPDGHLIPVEHGKLIWKSIVRDLNVLDKSIRGVE